MMRQLDYDYGFTLGLSLFSQSRGESAIPNIRFGGLLPRTESLGLRTETMLECLELLAPDGVSTPSEELGNRERDDSTWFVARHPVDDADEDFDGDVVDDDEEIDDDLVGDEDDEDEDFDEEDEFDDDEDFDDELDDEIDDIDMDEEDEFDDDEDDDDFGDDEFDDDEDLDVD